MYAAGTTHTHEVLARVEANLVSVRRASTRLWRTSSAHFLRHACWLWWRHGSSRPTKRWPTARRRRRRRRRWWLSRHDEHGTRTLVAGTASAGVRRLHSTIDHLAHLLHQHGDDQQRSRSMDQLRAEGRAPGRPPHSAAADEGARRPGSTPAPPRAVVDVHFVPDALLGRGVARAEELGASTRQQLIDLLGHHQISLRPVIDLNQGMAAECYEIPAAIDERLQLTKPADVFPSRGR